MQVAGLHHDQGSCPILAEWGARRAEEVMRKQEESGEERRGTE